MGWKQLFDKRAVLTVLLAAAALSVYGRSLQNEFVMWDDNSLVYENPLTQQMTPATVGGAFTSYDPELYVPLTIVSFQLEHALFGFRPFFFHLDNLLLHMLAASLVLLLLERLGLRRGTAFLGALLFTIHPINTEAVAWVSARKDLLSAVFSLSAILCYLRYRSQVHRPFFWLTLGFFLLALLSKPVAIFLPLVFLLLDWERDGRIAKGDILGKIPLLLLSVLFLAIGLYGKQRNIEALTLLETMLLAAKSMVFSIHTFFWPKGLSPIYLQTDPIGMSSAQFWIPMLVLTAAFGMVLWSTRKTKAVAFGCLWYLLFLVPSFSNFAKDRAVYFFSDRYIYLPQIGILFLLGYGWDRLRRDNSRGVTIGVGLLITAAGAMSGGAAYAQSALWHDSETLYRDVLRKNDRSVVMHYNLAVLEHRKGNREAALLGYRRAIAIDPQYAKARNNLGMLHKEDGHIAEAMEELHRAAQSDPRLPDPHSNMGSILMDRGDIDGAIAEFRTAIGLNDRYAQAHINLAAALGRKGLYEEGLREYKRAFELAPQLLDGLPEIRRALENF